jgi:hypothetical protein
MRKRGSAELSKSKRGTLARYARALGIAILAVSSTTSVTAAPASAVLRSAVEMAPTNIPSDCTRDVTTALVSWIKSVPDGSTLSFAPGGCYRVDGSLIVTKRSHLTFDGNGATIRAGSDGNRERVHVWFLDGTAITVRDLTIHGANPHAGATAAAYVPTREFQHGFAFRGVDGGWLDHVQVQDVYGDFVYIGADDDTGEWSQNIRITNSTFNGSGRQGISVTAGDHVTIQHNTIRNVARSMFDLEPNSPEQGAQHVVIEHNVTGAAKNFWIASKGSGSNIAFTATNNTMTAATGNLIWVYGARDGYRGPLVIENNHFKVGGTVNDESSKGAFFFAKVDGVTIKGNKVSFPTGRHIPAVEIRDSKHLDISGNSFRRASKQLLDTSPAYSAQG